METSEGAPSVQRDEPALRDVESREETVARVAGQEEAVVAVRGGSSDPSTRRGLNRLVWRTIALWGAIGFAVGAVLAVILSLIPGPFETSSVGGTVGYAIGLGAALALVFALLSTLFTLEREDGRIEREIEQQRTGGQPAPASPSDPSHDPPAR